MTNYEIKRKKAKQRRRLIISLTLIVVGLGMVITAAILEASHYPWGVMFGTATQNADAIPDPSPINLEIEDKDVIITIEAPSATVSAADATVAPSVSDTTPSAGNALPGNVEDTAKAPAVSKFVVIGTLKIPVLSVSQNLLEGAGKQMKYGVGHLPSTAAPGQKGNCAISGHRPYPFRYLDQLKTGDNIVIKTGGVTYTYSVFDSFAVLPNEVWVLNNVPGEDYTLTLITCTPYLISSHRLIVRARLNDIDGKTPQEYYGDTTTDVTTDVTLPEVIPSDSTDPGSTDTSADPSAIMEVPVSPDATSDVTPEMPSPLQDSTSTETLPVSQ